MLITRQLLAGVLAACTLSGCATVGGRSDSRPEASRQAAEAPMEALPTTPEEFLRAARGMYVVVDLDLNRLRMMDGRTVLWEAPVGTGTGLRLQSDDGEWHFTTPEGVFQIQYKEELPVWYLPDWYYVEKKLPIPAQNAPERKVAGQLGVAAVYLGREIAIHGTDKPELLGQRVSHGCIRLENDFALRLFHNVQVGTPVVITGGRRLAELPPPPTPTATRAPQPKPKDPFAGIASSVLLTRLDRELAQPQPGREWVRIASRLITRGLRDDADALRGLLSRAGTAKSPERNRELATFLADAFARGGLRTVVSLARIDRVPRQRAARAIVEATMSMHPGTLDDQTAPWPTRRVLPSELGPAGRAGWEALAAAEAAYRTAQRGAAPAAVAR